MLTSELPDPIQKEILNVDEAAAYLGVSTKTFQKVLHEGEMPGRKVGREWKFSRRALEEWIGRSRSRDFLDRDDEDEEIGTPPKRGENDAGSGGPVRRPAGVPRRASVRPGFHEDED